MSRWTPWNWLRHEQSSSNQSLPIGRSFPSHLSQRLDAANLFDDFFKGLDLPVYFGGTDGWFRPSMDIREKDNQYMIEMEIPGVSKNDIEIRLDNDVLTIKGEKKSEAVSDSEQDSRHCKERIYGSFQRSLSLPADANSETLTANFSDGVLTVSIEKSEAKTPDSRHIEVL